MKFQRFIALVAIAASLAALVGYFTHDLDLWFSGLPIAIGLIALSMAVSSMEKE